MADSVKSRPLPSLCVLAVFPAIFRRVWAKSFIVCARRNAAKFGGFLNDFFWQIFTGDRRPIICHPENKQLAANCEFFAFGVVPHLALVFFTGVRIYNSPHISSISREFQSRKPQINGWDFIPFARSFGDKKVSATPPESSYIKTILAVKTPPLS